MERDVNSMSTIDKVKVGDTTYDVSPSATGTLNGYTSNDNGTPPPAEWGEVSTISSGDTNSSIFSKLTSMVRNVRWLYNKLGTVDISSIGNGTISGGLNTIQSELDDKADSGHTHSVGDLPVSNVQVNSTSYVPSSSVVYSVNSELDALNSEIQSIKNALDPNNRYDKSAKYTWSSVSDVDTFLNRFNNDNLYRDNDVKLSLGNIISIKDGTYNVDWKIAGFDMEHNQTAADGTVYDNGYGICLVPVQFVDSNYWSYTSGADYYSNSSMHLTYLPNIVSGLENVLGTHIVQRNVLLANKCDTNNIVRPSSGYAWMTSKSELMSAGQLTGTFGKHLTKYDDGEANYKLPLFDHENYWNTISAREFWLRNYQGYSNYSGAFFAYTVYSSSDTKGNISQASISGNMLYIRPMIYIR